MAVDYEKAGVSLEAGYDVVKRIKKHVASTYRLGTMGNIGAFGGMFDLSLLGLKEPVLVSGTDGVGTKLKIAFEMDKHDTIGIDAVAMCVNDVIAQGAQPLFFLDYIAQGKTVPQTVEAIVSGIAEGCRQANCALIGGETAEMPGMYPEGEYDLAGFAVGVVEKERVINGRSIKAGDIVLGLASNGAHSNGYSLVRKIIARDNPDLDAEFDNGKTLRETIIAPTRLYVKPILAALEKFTVKGMAHITGGGITENVPRILPENTVAQIDAKAWELPKLFQWLQQAGNVETQEMYRTFNCGIGMAVIVPAEQAEAAQGFLTEQGETVYRLGTIRERAGSEHQTQVA